MKQIAHLPRAWVRGRDREHVPWCSPLGWAQDTHRMYTRQAFASQAFPDWQIAVPATTAGTYNVSGLSTVLVPHSGHGSMEGSVTLFPQMDM